MLIYVDADHILRELAKIDPIQMREYQFEKYLENSEGYKLIVLHILELYIDKKNTVNGTSNKSLL